MEKALYLLAELSERDFDWFVQNGELVQIASGQPLIKEGDPINAIYLVLEGTLAVTVNALKEHEIARLSAGEIVGEMSFVDERAPSATVSALDQVQVWKIPRVKLLQKLSNDRSFAANFYQAIAIWLSHRLRGTISRWGYAYGYGKEESPAIAASDDAPVQASDGLEIARIRLDWLFSRLKDVKDIR
ncbi:MAG: cyclic nucleotide-binding domain-containing protein [Elainellaceae cyanobacterium]